MRKPLVLFFLLLAAFSWIWISRARNPSNRPDSYADGLQDSAYWWSDVSAEPVSSQWQLSAGVPENYIPVPGKSGLYMVVDEEGYIIAYRQGTRREDGTWDWKDVNPDIPENYEAVPGLKDVYKVTAEDGSVRYFRYIRNRDDTFAFVEVDARGNVIGEKEPSGAEIPENYEQVSRNQYAVHNDNGVVVGYKERVPDKNAESGFTWVNIDEPDQSSLELPDIGFDLKTDVTGTGDLTGGVRDYAGFGPDTGSAAVPTLMPAADVSANAGNQSGSSFFFSQPEVRVEISQVQITPPPSLQAGDSASGALSQNPGGYTFSGEIVQSSLNVSVPTLDPSQIQNVSGYELSGISGGENYLQSVSVSNPGYYVSTETSYTQKQEGNALVTYAVVTERTYDSQGNLIGTRAEDPVEVSRQETASASASSSAAASSLSEEYSRISGLLSSAGGSFNTSVPNEMVILLNSSRSGEGLPILTFNGNSPAYQLALCRAAMMALSGSGNNSLPQYGKLSDMCSMYGVSVSSPSENMLITAASSAEAVHSALQSGSGQSARMSASYSEIAIAIVQKDGMFYIDEVFIR